MSEAAPVRAGCTPDCGVRRGHSRCRDRKDSSTDQPRDVFEPRDIGRRQDQIAARSCYAPDLAQHTARIVQQVLDDFGENDQIELVVIVGKPVPFDVEVLERHHFGGLATTVELIVVNRLAIFAILVVAKVIGQRNFEMCELLEQHGREIGVAAKFEAFACDVMGKSPGVDESAEIVCAVGAHFGFGGVGNPHRSDEVEQLLLGYAERQWQGRADGEQFLRRFSQPPTYRAGHAVEHLEYLPQRPSSIPVQALAPRWPSRVVARFPSRSGKACPEMVAGPLFPSAIAISRIAAPNSIPDLPPK